MINKAYPTDDAEVIAWYESFMEWLALIRSTPKPEPTPKSEKRGRL